MANYVEQIAAYEAKRSSLLAANDGILSKASAEGRTFDAEEKEAHANNKADIVEIDEHLEILRDAEKAQRKSLTPVEGQTQKQGTESRTFAQPIKVEKKLAPGIQFARLAKVKALSKIDGESPRTVAKELFGEDSSIYGLVSKVAVPAATTGAQDWAGALVSQDNGVYADFLEFLRPMTILGQFGQGGIPSLRNVPFRTRLLGQTTGGSAAWVGEGKAKPLTRWTYGVNSLSETKVAAIAVATEELLRRSSPAAEGLLRDELAAAVAERLDIDFINPAKAAVTDVSPAGILNGVTGIASAGTSADDIRADVATLFSAFIAGNNAPTSGVWIMRSTTALALSLIRNPLGQAEFPAVNMGGGTFEGLPVIVSQYVPAGIVALVNAQDIYVADEGGVQVDLSREASLEMDTAPAQNSDTPTPAELVSMFQTNSVAFRSERTINWARRRPVSVAYLTGVAWGS